MLSFIFKAAFVSFIDTDAIIIIILSNSSSAHPTQMSEFLALNCFSIWNLYLIFHLYCCVQINNFYLDSVGTKIEYTTLSDALDRSVELIFTFCHIKITNVYKELVVKECIDKITH